MSLFILLFSTFFTWCYAFYGWANPLQRLRRRCDQRVCVSSDAPRPAPRCEYCCRSSVASWCTGRVGNDGRLIIVVRAKSSSTYLCVCAHTRLVQLGLDVVQPMLWFVVTGIVLGYVQQMAHTLAQCLEYDASYHMVAIVGRQIATEFIEIWMQSSQFDVCRLRLADSFVHILVDLRHGNCKVSIVHFQFLNVPQWQIDGASGFQMFRFCAGIQKAWGETGRVVSGAWWTNFASSCCCLPIRCRRVLTLHSTFSWVTNISSIE